MPGPSIVNRAAQERQTAATERKTYFLTDPFCKEIHGLEVTDHIREKGLVLTSAEALALVASGAVTTDRDAAKTALDDMKGRHEALTEKRAEEWAADKKSDDEADEATMQNLGQNAGTSGQGAPAKSGDGSLTAREADAAIQSSSQPNTWAGDQMAGQ